MASRAEVAAMRQALDAARKPEHRISPNPRVGCVLLDPAGRVLSVGCHRGPGTPHAEADALARAGAAASGATAVVTLEPCDHQGRTGPCTAALVAAGVIRVVYAVDDPNPLATGGAAVLRAAGVEVEGGVLADVAYALNERWLTAITRGRPYVTWKFATTLDGRSAAADGTSRWVSSRAARLDTHRLRSLCDTMLVGTHTVEVDDPELTVRDEVDQPVAVQPLRAVMGLRDLATDRRVLNDRAETVQLRTRDPEEALARLHELDRQHVFLEGGPTLARAFLAAGLVDEVVAYVAPMLLGAGASAVADLGIATIADALHLRVSDVTVLQGHDGEDTNVRLTMRPTTRRN